MAGNNLNEELPCESYRQKKQDREFYTVAFAKCELSQTHFLDDPELWLMCFERSSSWRTSYSATVQPEIGNEKLGWQLRIWSLTGRPRGAQLRHD